MVILCFFSKDWNKIDCHKRGSVTSACKACSSLTVKMSLLNHLLVSCVPPLQGRISVWITASIKHSNLQLPRDSYVAVLRLRAHSLCPPPPQSLDPPLLWMWYLWQFVNVCMLAYFCRWGGDRRKCEGLAHVDSMSRPIKTSYVKIDPTQKTGPSRTKFGNQNRSGRIFFLDEVRELSHQTMEN